jgi:hypothetical protein
MAVLLGLCAGLPLTWRAPAQAAAETPQEWPAVWDGKPLRPLATSAVEQRFSASFPGAIGRFTDGDRIVVLRNVRRPTRMLHPAADCYRGLGYRIEAARLEHDERQRLWRCFTAERGGQRLRVCERIEGHDGGTFTDASAWFWAASFGASAGPWQAVTVVQRL